MSLHGWSSIRILLNFDVELLLVFTILIKGEGGGDRDVLSCLQGPSLSLLLCTHVAS